MIMHYNRARTHAHFIMEEGDTEQLRRIVTRFLPKVIHRFSIKNRAYGENTFPLGLAGQFPEIDRKVRLLKAAIWDKRETATSIESAEETVGDLIGHLLMLLDCMEKQRTGLPQFTPPAMAPGDNVAGHLIREAKGGPETWVDQGGLSGGFRVDVPRGSALIEEPTAATASHTETDADGVKRYPPQFRGRHTFIVGSVVRDPEGITRVLMTAHGHTIRVANEARETRCGWQAGEPGRSGDAQCVGIEGHGDPVDVGGITGLISEDYHINKELEAWPV
jgi:hypothetical protein